MLSFYVSNIGTLDLMYNIIDIDKIKVENVKLDKILWDKISV